MSICPLYYPITYISADHPSTPSLPYATIPVPSLYPVYLPYFAQHELLVEVQAVLEDIGYDFGKAKMKDAVEREGWDCAQSVELNKWMPLLFSNQHHFLPNSLGRRGQRLPKLMKSVSEIRHTAVHRLRVTTGRLEELVADGETLARLLCDDGRIQTLERLRRELQLKSDDLKRNKDLLESKLNSKLKIIADQRAELDRLEQLAVEEMLVEDREYRGLAGPNLKQAICSPDTAVQSGTRTEMELDVDTDLNGRRDMGTRIFLEELLK